MFHTQVPGLSTDYDAEGNPTFPVVFDGSTYTDPTRPNRLPYKVRLHCPKDSRGKAFRIPLNAYREETHWKDLAFITLRCS